MDYVAEALDIIVLGRKDEGKRLSRVNLPSTDGPKGSFVLRQRDLVGYTAREKANWAEQICGL
jgi:hypothetical protein